MLLRLLNVVSTSHRSPCAIKKEPADSKGERGFQFFKCGVAKKRWASAGVNAEGRWVLGPLIGWLLVLIKLSNGDKVRKGRDKMQLVAPRKAPDCVDSWHCSVRHSQHRQFCKVERAGVCLPAVSVRAYLLHVFLRDSCGCPTISPSTHTDKQCMFFGMYSANLQNAIAENAASLAETSFNASHISDRPYRPLTYFGFLFHLLSQPSFLLLTPPARKLWCQSKQISHFCGAPHLCFFSLFEGCFFFSKRQGMTTEKKKNTRAVCNMFDPGRESFSDPLSELFRESASGSDARNRLFVQFLSYYSCYINEAHHNANIDQPAHLFWTIVIKKGPFKFANKSQKNESRFERKQEFRWKFCFSKTNPEICVLIAAFLWGPDGWLQQWAVQQLLRRPPTRAPPVGRQSVIPAHGHREQPRSAVLPLQASTSRVLSRITVDSMFCLLVFFKRITNIPLHIGWVSVYFCWILKKKPQHQLVTVFECSLSLPSLPGSCRPDLDTASSYFLVLSAEYEMQWQQCWLSTPGFPKNIASQVPSHVHQSMYK